MANLRPSQICTNYKQSGRLIKAGVQPETADMYVYVYEGNEFIGYGKPDSDSSAYNPLPAWSLARLIEMLPKSSVQYTIDLQICNNASEDNPLYWFEGDGPCDISGSKNIYDATVELIEELINVRFFDYVDWSKRKDGIKMPKFIKKIIRC